MELRAVERAKGDPAVVRTPMKPAPGDWHLKRAAGARERFARARSCGTTAIVKVSCAKCHTATSYPSTCGSRLACADCRKTLAHGYKDDLKYSFDLLRKRLFRVMRMGNPAERWSEKFLTLTAPDLATKDAKERIERVCRAWEHFRDSWNAWWAPATKTREEGPGYASIEAAREKVPTLDGQTWTAIKRCYGPEAPPDPGRPWARPHFVRVIEWTSGQVATGGDGLGHPHIHAWLLSPMLESSPGAKDGHELVTGWWRRALMREGFTEEETAVLSVKLKRAGEDIEDELIKYLVKDFVEGGERSQRIEPELMAQVYEALSGRRQVQASARLIGYARENHGRCGSCKARWRRAPKDCFPWERPIGVLWVDVKPTRLEFKEGGKLPQGPPEYPEPPNWSETQGYTRHPSPFLLGPYRTDVARTSVRQWLGRYRTAAHQNIRQAIGHFERFGAPLQQGRFLVGACIPKKRRASS